MIISPLTPPSERPPPPRETHYFRTSLRRHQQTPAAIQQSGNLGSRARSLFLEKIPPFLPSFLPAAEKRGNDGRGRDTEPSS